MVNKNILSLLLVFCVLSLAACSTQKDRRQTIDKRSACHIIYDAGSSRTRLYVYQQTSDGWLKHSGPRTSALADPVRGIRGKTMSDAPAVIAELVHALGAMRSDGAWPAFDWHQHCRVDVAGVYATAGMRLAEQLDPEASEQLWRMLNAELSNALGMPVSTRTLTGYEEGLFAWLAIRQGREDGDFGVAEMGGASAQITFPCPDCEASRPVRVDAAVVPIFSHSFLGWGQDEAWKKFRPLPACARGIGKDTPGWKIADCAIGMPLSPTDVTAIVKHPDAMDSLRWFLSGAFRYMNDTDIDHYCRQGIDSGFEPETSCFRAVYLQKVLETLAVPGGSEKTDVDWTLGAVVCTATQCLEPVY